MLDRLEGAIGRPNWCRVRAYSAAVAEHQPATAAASTAYSVAARARTRAVETPGRIWPGAMTAPVNRMVASGREKSTGVRSVTVTPG